MLVSSTLMLTLLGQLLAASTLTTSPALKRASASAPTSYVAAPAVAGRVVTEAGEPLPGVFVALQGTPQATSTNAAGSFLLVLAGAKPVLLFKCQGYRNQTVAAELGKPLIVKMFAVARSAAAAFDAPAAPAEAVAVASAPAVLAFAEVMPAFPGGDAAYCKFISEHAHFPEQAIAEGLSGTVFVSFVVDEQGRITNAEVLRGSGHGFDEEALRVVRLMPWWTPGMMNGKPVRVSHTLRIPFVFRER